MLRKLSSKTHTFFTSGSFSLSSIKIHIDEIIHDKYIEPTNRIKRFHDKNDQCMKAVVQDFAITETEQLGFKRNQYQVEFTLKDISNLNIRYTCKDKIDYTALDNHYLVSKCVAESLVKLLYQHKIVSNDLVIFEGKRGTSMTDHFSIYSNRLEMTSHPTSNASTSNDLVSMVHAQLEDNKIFILLNTVNSAVLDEIRKIFSAHVKEKEAVVDNNMVINL